MPQWIERGVQEDLSVGTGEVWLKAPGGGDILSTQMGIHSVSRGQKAHSFTWAPGAVAAAGKTSTTVTVPTAEPGDLVLVTHDEILASPMRLSGHVSASGFVRVLLHNPTAAAVTVPSGLLAVLVLPSRPNLEPFTVLELTINLGGGPTVPVFAVDFIGASNGYDSFLVSTNATGPFTAGISLGCPVGDTAVYVEGRRGGGHPLVLGGTVTLTDNLGVCP